MAIYRAAKNPHRVGELRVKSWACIVPAVPDPEDPVWSKRCRDYWLRQSRLYGVRFANFMFLFDEEIGAVSTYAVVDEVLPGERTWDFSKVPNPENLDA